MTSDPSLIEDEHLVLRLHPHWKTLVRPLAVAVVIIAIALVAEVLIPSGSAAAIGRLAVAVVAIGVLMIWLIVPILRWRTTVFELTSRRLRMRDGIITRHGRDIPLARINDVSFSKGLLDRLLGSGRLVVRVGRRARPDRAHRHPARGSHPGHAVPAGRGGTEPAGAGPAEPAVTGMETIRLSQPGDGIAEITLDRPAAMNAVSSAMAEELTRACEQLAIATEVRVVVFSAAGERAFSAGADLKERAGLSDADIMAQRHVIRGLFGALLALPQPAIAAVHGFALGGGCELALSCDLVVADETAVFGLPEVTVGLVPGGGGTQLALRRLGPGRAADLVLTGRNAGIDEAERLGLVDRRVPVARTGRPPASWPPRSPPTRRWRSGRPAGPAARLGGLAGGQASTSRTPPGGPRPPRPDRREGIAAFAEKRKPVWPGRVTKPRSAYFSTLTVGD